MATGDSGVFDLYGFELLVNQHDKAARYACAQYALRREAKWEPFVRAKALPEPRKLKRFVRKGVPPALRDWVWWHTSGAAELRAAHEPGHFHAMVIDGEARPCVRQIELVRFAALFVMFACLLDAGAGVCVVACCACVL